MESTNQHQLVVLKQVLFANMENRTKCVFLILSRLISTTRKKAASQWTSSFFPFLGSLLKNIFK